MTRPEISRASLRSRDRNPAFQEQWHAQVVAIVELLLASGKLDPEDWSQTLGAELEKRARAGETDDDATYYGAFKAALELVLDRTGIASYSEVDRRESAWRQAYLSTPHGRPVTLPG
ncbi:hypothetical protein [Rhizobium anhuiense]|uniref:Nitrile hydratase accessory protein n=1 Tax=Rhizobium anhuiense TaxID=1184720 RepID=A0A432NSW5_9HYPH|nr:hypothetical protein [Rhizobium anhuiense]RUM02413.1 hypothetical protein EEQ99_11785 [Rhizobium anhuiense]GGD78679.1 nitrile hydratase accessory protein [Rhizobium anhuiense]